MAWRIVQQPNGKYARFSDIVDDFTMYDMSEEDALKMCHYQFGMTQRDAFEKVQKGLMAGQTRFRDELRTIANVHGRTRMRKRCKQLGGTREDYPPRSR